MTSPASSHLRHTDLLLRLHDGSTVRAAGRRLRRNSGDRYTVLEPSPGLELIPGDLVQARRDHLGNFQVTGIVALNGHATIALRILPTIVPEELEEIVDILDVDELAFHDLPGGDHLFVWDEAIHLPLEETVERLRTLAVSEVSVTTQFQRSRMLRRAAEFQLPPEPAYPRILNETIAALRKRAGTSHCFHLPAEHGRTGGGVAA